MKMLPEDDAHLQCLQNKPWATPKVPIKKLRLGREKGRER